VTAQPGKREPTNLREPSPGSLNRQLSYLWTISYVMGPY